MKTNVILTLLLGTVFTACEKNATISIISGVPEEIANVEKDTHDLVFEGFVDDDAITRTTLNSEGSNLYSLQWERGDAISIYDGNRTAIYSTSNSYTTNATFKKVDGNLNESASSYLAFYPSSITKDNQVLSSTQRYVSNDVESFPMMAKSSNKQLYFKSLCGIIRINLKKAEDTDMKVSKISVYDSSLGMSGRFSVNSDNAAVVSGTNGVVLECDSPVNLYSSSATAFNIIVPQGNYSSFKIKIVDSSGREINLGANSVVKVTRGTITNISINLSSNSFDSNLETITVTDSNVNFTSI